MRSPKREVRYGRGNASDEGDPVLSWEEDQPDTSLVPAQSRVRTMLENVLPPVAGLAVLIGAWIAVIRWQHTSPLIAPSPGDVVNGFRDNAGDLLTAVWSTFQDAALGLALSIVVGVLLAVVMSQSKLLERAIYPYSSLAQTVPIFAIAPLIGTIVGNSQLPVGHLPIVLVSFIISVFPIIANSILGLTSVDPSHRNLFKMYNASRLQELLFLRVPFAVPYILTGVRVSSGLAIIGAIVGEVYLGNGGPQDGGLGYETWTAGTQGQWGLLGASALSAGLLGVGVFIALGALNTVVLRRWHESALRPES